MATEKYAERFTRKRLIDPQLTAAGWRVTRYNTAMISILLVVIRSPLGNILPKMERLVTGIRMSCTSSPGSQGNLHRP